jgi:hypothetical protein
MSNPQHPIPSKTKGFDLWCSQLELAGERYGFAWAQLAEALREYRASLSASNSSPPFRKSRIPESTQEYLATVRTIAELIERGSAEFAGNETPAPPVRERRLACRYPVQMELEYRLLHRGEVVGAGRGRTINTSSAGILFEADVPLPVQTIIQLCLDWPEVPSAAARVALYVAGRTVRCHGNITAAAIERHDFRILRDTGNRDKSFTL